MPSRSTDAHVISTFNGFTGGENDLEVVPCKKRPKLIPSDYAGTYTVIPCPKASNVSARVGTPVVLPATFGGSPRALHQSYLYAMAMNTRYGQMFAPLETYGPITSREQTQRTVR